MLRKTLIFCALAGCSNPSLPPMDLRPDAEVDLKVEQPDVAIDATIDRTDEEIEVCVPTTVYETDLDGDGFAPRGARETEQCILPSERSQFITQSRDCNDNDPLQFPRSPGICGDNVVDDCGGSGPVNRGGALCESGDTLCPETQEGTLDDPDWECVGVAPQNVYAYAVIADANGTYEDGGCFVFFEGYPGGFYVKQNLRRIDQSAECNTVEGCVCPTPVGMPSYDRRLYAFTTDSDKELCETIRLQDHGCGEELVQPVSNDCRKYLYQLHPFEFTESNEPIERPYSFFANSFDEAVRRLEAFETVEIACVENSNDGLGWAELARFPVVQNPTFRKKPEIEN